MSDFSLQRAREEIARREVGRTNVGRRLAGLLVAQFLLVVGGAPLGELVRDLAAPHDGDTLPGRLSRLALPFAAPGPSEGPLFARILATNRALLAELERFETDAEDSSPLARSLRPPTQSLLVALGAGTEQVYCGRPPWLFYRPSLDYVAGPDFLDPRTLARRRRAARAEGRSLQPDPRRAIRHLAAQLEARGIALVVVPTPVKPSFHPERLARGLGGIELPLRPDGYRRLVRELEDDGVLVFDPGPALAEAKREGGAAYLATDTHWTADAVERVARRLGDFLLARVALPPLPPAGYVREEAEVTNRGDLARMLDLPAGQRRYPPERIRLRPVRRADGASWRADRAADVLLLGDSFTNIYSLGEMGWGASAGLAEQLSFDLQRPLDRIVRNADGAFASRELLARELAAGRDRLAGKRVVIFQFAERELAVGDWRLVELALGDRGPERFFVPGPGEEIVVTGTIREIAPIPLPGTVPYADHIAALHLVDLASEEADVRGRDAVVYVWGMRDHVLQRAARLRLGERITMRLRPWADVADRYDGINRTELAGEAVGLAEPAWGEVVE